MLSSAVFNKNSTDQAWECPEVDQPVCLAESSTLHGKQSLAAVIAAERVRGIHSAPPGLILPAAIAFLSLRPRTWSCKELAKSGPVPSILCMQHLSACYLVAARAQLPIKKVAMQTARGPSWSPCVKQSLSFCNLACLQMASGATWHLFCLACIMAVRRHR